MTAVLLTLVILSGLMTMVLITWLAVGRVYNNACVDAYHNNTAEYHLPFLLMMRVDVSRREASIEETQFAMQIYFRGHG